jgi:hypothetical protein
MRDNVGDLLSLNNKHKSESKASEYVILAEASEGFISAGILPYIRLNILVKSETDSLFCFLRFPNYMNSRKNIFCHPNVSKRYFCFKTFAIIVLFRECFWIHRIGFMFFDVSDQTSVVHHQESVI